MIMCYDDWQDAVIDMIHRLKLLTKQVEDGLELRKQLNESVNDLQRQLTNEREENKKAKKR